MPRIWKPSVTVAAIVEKDGKFLLIEEETSDGIRINQPAGHLDPYESLQEAVIRETLEETAYDFTPTALVGMYMSRYTSNRTGEEVTYLRFTFCGHPGEKHDRPLDEGILRTMWLIMRLTSWWSPIGTPKVWRSLAYLTAASSDAWMSPTAPAATVYRPLSSAVMAILKPSPKYPAKFPVRLVEAPMCSSQS